MLLSLLFACDVAPDSSEGPGVPAASDCVVEDGLVGDLKVVVTAMPTVLRATWTLDGSQQGSLRFVDSTGRWALNAPGEGLMVGLLPSREVSYQVVHEAEGERRCTPVFTAETGELDVPSLEVQGALSPGYTVTPIVGITSTAVILDSQGQVVWALEIDAPAETPMIRARLGLDRASVLYHTRSSAPDEGEVVRVGLDGEVISRFPVPGIEVDFDELEDGRVAALDTEMRKYSDGQVLRGDRLVIADGTDVTVLWQVLDQGGRKVRASADR